MGRLLLGLVGHGNEPHGKHALRLESLLGAFDDLESIVGRHDTMVIELNLEIPQKNKEFEIGPPVKGPGISL